MKTNPILKEIRATRDQLAEQAGGDLRRLFDMVHQQASATRAKGETLIEEPKPCAVLREEPAKYVVK
jgi:hypothetical protein